MGGKIDHNVRGKRGPYNFIIYGSNYRKIGTLFPKPRKQPCFGQLYIYDSKNEVQNRVTHIRKGCVAIMVCESILACSDGCN